MTSVRALFRLLRTSMVLASTLLVGLWVMEPIDVMRQLSWEARKEQWLIDCVPTAGDGGTGNTQSIPSRHVSKGDISAAVASVHLFLDSELESAVPPVFDWATGWPSSLHLPSAPLRGPPCA